MRDRLSPQRHERRIFTFLSFLVLISVLATLLPAAPRAAASPHQPQPKLLPPSLPVMAAPVPAGAAARPQLPQGISGVETFLSADAAQEVLITWMSDRAYRFRIDYGSTQTLGQRAALDSLESSALASGGYSHSVKIPGTANARFYRISALHPATKHVVAVSAIQRIGSSRPQSTRLSAPAQGQHHDHQHGVESIGAQSTLTPNPGLDSDQVYCEYGGTNKGPLANPRDCDDMAGGLPEMDGSSSGTPDVESVGDPVSIGDGAWYTRIPCLGIGGAGLPINVGLRYSSHMWFDRIGVNTIGRGWTVGYSRRLTFDKLTADYFTPTPSLMLTLESGERWPYYDAGNGNYTAGNGNYTRLSYNAATQEYTLTYRNGIKDIFAKDGLLKRVEDRFGNQTLISFDAATGVQTLTNNRTQQSIRLEHELVSSSNKWRLVRIKDGPNNGGTARQITLSYNATGQLVKVTDAANRVYTFGYESTDAATARITSYYDPMNDPAVVTNARPLTIRYRSDGFNHRVERQVLPNGTTIDFPFQWNGATARMEVVYNAGLTDERRQVFIMSTRSNSGLAGRIFEYSLPNSTAVYKMDYDDHGNLIRITDPIGRKIEYRYDTDGDRREILAYKDATTYDLTTIDHNAFGQQTFIQEPAGAITRSTYNATTGALETLVREVSGASQTTRLSYDPVTIKGTAVQAGLVTKVTLPDGTVHTQSYDSLGYPATTTYDAGSGRLNLTEQSSYDWRGFLISQTNLQGITTSYEYATSAGHYGNVGWPSAEVFDSASGGRAIRTEYSYNALGHMTRQVIDAGAAPRLNATWAYEYRPVGTEGGYSVTRVTDPLNQVVAYDYTSYGELKQIVEASQNNRTTRFEYHPQGWLWKTILSDSRVSETILYNDVGQPRSISDARGVTIEYTYDGKGRLQTARLGTTAIGTAPAINALYTYGYDANDRVTSVQDPLNNVNVQRQYDGYNRLAWEKDALGNQTSYGYDANRNWLTLTTVGSNNSAEQLQTRYDYDAVGRVRQMVSDPGSGRLNLTTRYRYEVAGSSDRWNLQELQEPRTDVTAINRYSYNSLGLLATTTDALGQTWRYAYNNLGYLTTSTDALNRATSYQPDLLGRVRSETINGKSQLWEYNADDTLKRYTDQGGRVTEYGYDTTGRLRTIDYTPLSSTSDDVTLSYTANDLLESVQDSLSTTSYGYDALNRMTGRTRDGRTLGYTYKANGWLEKLSYWGRNDVSYGYDAAGRVTAVSPFSASPTSYSYRSTGLLREMQRPDNLIKTTYGYDSASRLTDLNHSRIGTSYERVQYTLDGNGNRTAMTDSFGTTSYSYDALNRLSSVTYPAITNGPNTSTINYGYDPVGNRSSSTITGAASQPQTISGLSVWLRADAGLTTDSASGVSSWINQANTATSASQASASKRPILSAASANGKPAVRFDGVDDTLGSNLSSSASSEQTIIVVAKGQQYQSLVRFQNAATPYIVYPWGSAKNYIISSDNNGAGIASGLVENEWNIGVARYKAGTANGMQTFRNGTLVAQRTSASTTLPSAPLTIGSYLGSSEFAKADIAEILVYNRALSDSERQGVEQYLSQKYSVTVSSSRQATTNLALQRFGFVKQSSTASASIGGAGEAGRAVDGNTAGSYGYETVTLTNSEAQPWWEVDLGSITSIQTIDIWNRSDCCAERLSNFSVLVSDTPFSSTSLDTARNQVGVSSYPVPGQAGRPTTLSINRSGRYVRVQLAGTGVLSLAEVQVWGTPSTPRETVWVDDAVPAGAVSYGTWNWITSNPTPFSGTRSHQEPLASGVHQHYFEGATATLTPNAGDTLFAYVYLDPSAPPTELMLQWNDGNWEHRAYWGANAIPWGVDGTDSRRYMGPLPASGRWVRLEVPASLVGLEGKPIRGMAFTLFDGRATWDKAGKATGLDGTTSFSYDANDRISSAGFEYDAAGNLTRDAEGTTYVYDTANRLIKTVKGTITTEYFYDGLGNLIRQKVNNVTTDFILDESGSLPRVVGEIQGTTETMYAYGPEGLHAQRQVINGGYTMIDYLLVDDRGSFRLPSNNTYKLSYDAWGNVRYKSGNGQTPGFGYTGEQQGSNGLVYLRARHYAPQLGRFLQRDTFPGFATRPQSLNRYAYTENNPVNFIDPTGHSSLEVHNYTPKDRDARAAVQAARQAARKNAQASRPPTVTTTVRDRTTGQTWSAGSGQRYPSRGVHPAIQGRLPDPSQMPWSCTNCAEPNALSRALHDGAKARNLDMASVETRSGKPVNRCKNCQISTPPDVRVVTDHPTRGSIPDSFTKKGGRHLKRLGQAVPGAGLALGILSDPANATECGFRITPGSVWNNLLGEIPVVGDMFVPETSAPATLEDARRMGLVP
jgi:RHS repeat-associated protein